MKDLVRNYRSGIRLAALRRVAADDIVATPEAFASLIISYLALLVLLGLLHAGPEGQFNYFELPRALLVVPLTLGFGLLVASANRDRALMMRLAVALAAAGVVVTAVVGMVALVVTLPVTAGWARHWQAVYTFLHAWWVTVVIVTVVRLAPADRRRRIGNVVAGVVLLVLPGWFLPQRYLWTPAYRDAAGSRAGLWALAEEGGFYAQQSLLAKALDGLAPERQGVPDLYLVAAGLYAGEDVFMKEVRVIETLFRERFDAAGRSVVLINNPATVREHPVASLTSLTAALRRVGELMNAEEDVLVLYVSSHGSEQHRLSVEFWPLRFDPVDPPALKRALDASGIKWKVIVVSACYSGGFIEPLKDEYNLIITASSASRQSFGCGSESDSTYLAKALFDEEMRKTHSFEAAFALARESIGQWEKERGYVPSEPQMHVGAAVRDKLRQVEARLAARAVANERTDAE